MKGIILAGGSGTRLYPSTLATSKQLLPVYDKPMIYYSLSVLMLAGIRDILIISTPEDLPKYQSLLSNGDTIGMNFTYKIQPSPDGLAQAFILGEEFISNENVCLILGDNFLYGHRLPDILISQKEKIELSGGASIFGYNVLNPEDYGVATVNGEKVVSIEEKPKDPTSNWAVIGLYMYDNNVKKVSKEIFSLKKSLSKSKNIKNLIIKKKKELIDSFNVKFDYLELRNIFNLKESIKTKNSRLFVAYYINKVRLIDNF